METLQLHNHRPRAERAPGYGNAETADVACRQRKGETEAIEAVGTQLQVVEHNLSPPHANPQLLLRDVLDELRRPRCQQVGQKRLKHPWVQPLAAQAWEAPLTAPGRPQSFFHGPRENGDGGPSPVKNSHGTETDVTDSHGTDTDGGEQVCRCGEVSGRTQCH